ncbi:hypothetical protein [Moraxella bovis]|uniref:Uncharacterized protein n=1 Tax=Moraxella bovis TaxID=476 RepID=A0A378PNV4_MORBO|nr:hypothetical protein [Moraxella bovis]UYZ80712.1 hypothetical protein LP113_11885 [Moraxella bovis]UZA06712.1 hypothetical protein LP099_02540 [Moraxella bovis]UZA11060.1 hypothetical protein LP123_11755 [Moraxella bovis]UZA16170.1 hypothetical protein LP109_11060 [Moraxella bovis]STY90235.1 Uncharacterised protein [Moraxella bovis]
MIHFNPGRALELLRQGSNNPNAQFRDGQEEAIAHLVTNTQRLLVVQKQVGEKVLSILLQQNY